MTIKEYRKNLVRAIDELNYYYEGDKGTSYEKVFFGEGSAQKTQAFIDKCQRRGVDLDELLESIVKNDWMIIEPFRDKNMKDVKIFVFKGSVVYAKMAFTTLGELVVDIHD